MKQSPFVKQAINTLKRHGFRTVQIDDWFDVLKKDGECVAKGMSANELRYLAMGIQIAKESK